MNSNKLIAEFMGLPKVACNIGTSDGCITEGYMHPKVDVPVTTSGMQYNISWDWLMSVVEKIRKVPSWDRDKFSTEVVIYGDKTSIKSKGYGEKEHSKSFFNKSVRGKYNSIEPTHKAVIEFIKWYNLNKNN